MWRRSTVLLSLGVLAAACLKAPPAEVKPAPEFELTDLGGAKVSLASLKGKVVVLDFWATWCGPCIAEIPDYTEFYKKNQPRGVEVIGVVLESGDPDEIQEFVAEHKIPYRQLLGTEKIQDAYGANQGFPTTFVIDGKGMIRSKTLGSPPKKFEELQRTVDSALSTD